MFKSLNTKLVHYVWNMVEKPGKIITLFTINAFYVQLNIEQIQLELINVNGNSIFFKLKTFSVPSSSHVLSALKLKFIRFSECDLLNSSS